MGTHALFHILWKLSDQTWVLSALIQHLGAVTDYLQVLGIEKVSELPVGKAKPPTDDPQTFLDPSDINL